MAGGQAWKFMPIIILALRRLREENCHKFEASLGYNVNFSYKARPCFKTFFQKEKQYDYLWRQGRMGSSEGQLDILGRWSQ